MASANLTSLRQIATATGLSLTFVKAMVGLSKPARAALRLKLTSLKRDLQAKLSTYAYKKRIAQRKGADISSIYQEASRILNESKRILNLLNFGPEFNDEPEIQKLINTLMSLAQIKGISLGGYRDAENIVNAINFLVQQNEKAITFADIAVNTANQKINKVDKYIAVLDAIDGLSQT